MEPLLNIIHEDAGLLVVNKPAGLVCHPTKGGALSSLVSRARLHLGGAVSAHLVNRLDRETSGVALLAKTGRHAGKLEQLFAGREVNKEYLAIVHGHVAANRGACDAPLGRDERSAVAIKDRARADGRAARTEFVVERRFERAEGKFTLLRALPRTGRKHQIRIHLALLGHPVVGDKLYGADERLYLAFVERRLTAEQRRQLLLPCHALHAERLTFRWMLNDWDFRAPPEDWFAGFASGSPLPDDWTERYR